MTAIADNVEYLPIWKANSTPSEWFEELSIMAKRHPERFEKVVVGTLETTKSGNWNIRHYWHGGNLAEAIGLFEMAKMRAYEESSK